MADLRPIPSSRKLATLHTFLLIIYNMIHPTALVCITYKVFSFCYLSFLHSFWQLHYTLITQLTLYITIMKQIKALFATIILILSCILSYYIGRMDGNSCHERDYEAACLQADFIRYIIDDFDGEISMANIGMEIQNSYEEYFQELDNHNIWKTEKITSIKDFDNYYWCY